MVEHVFRNNKFFMGIKNIEIKNTLLLVTFYEQPDELYSEK